MSTRDDVLRDLLLERGLTEEQVQALSTLVERVEWVNASPLLNNEGAWSEVDDIDDVVLKMDDRLRLVSSEMAPRRAEVQSNSRLSLEELTRYFSRVWGGVDSGDLTRYLP